MLPGASTMGDRGAGEFVGQKKRPTVYSGPNVRCRGLHDEAVRLQLRATALSAGREQQSIKIAELQPGIGDLVTVIYHGDDSYDVARLASSGAA